MRSREFYCANCGLFQWKDEATLKEGCLDTECVSHQGDNSTFIFAVNSTGFVYFYRGRTDQIKRMAWSSERYAPKSAIEHYKKQGMTIKQ